MCVPSHTGLYEVYVNNIDHTVNNTDIERVANSTECADGCGSQIGFILVHAVN